MRRGLSQYLGTDTYEGINLNGGQGIARLLNVSRKLGEESLQAGFILKVKEKLIFWMYRLRHRYRSSPLASRFESGPAPVVSSSASKGPGNEASGRFNGGYQDAPRPPAVSVKRQFSTVHRFTGQVLGYNIWYNNGELYNSRIVFEVDRVVFLKGVNIFSIRGGLETEFRCDVNVFENGSVRMTNKRMTRNGGLERYGTSQRGSGLNQYFTIMFDQGIPLAPENFYIVGVRVSARDSSGRAAGPGTHSVLPPSLPIQTFVGQNNIVNSTVNFGGRVKGHGDGNVTFSFFGGYDEDTIVGRFSSTQIPGLLFYLQK